MLRSLCVLLLLLCPALVSAQTTVPTAKPFRVLVDHDGANTTGYRCYLDDVKVGSDLAASARVDGVVTCDYAAIATPGTHTMGVTAFGAKAESKQARITAEFKEPAVPPPGDPTNPRIVTVEVALDAAGKLQSLRVVGVK